MSSIFDQLQGTAFAATPHFQLLEQAVALTPWWYPYMYLLAFGLFFGFRRLRRARARHDTRMALHRVQARAKRL